MLTVAGHVDAPEEESSGTSTTDSAHRVTLVSQPLPRSDSSVHRHLCNQLRELEDENKKYGIASRCEAVSANTIACLYQCEDRK